MFKKLSFFLVALLSMTSIFGVSNVSFAKEVKEDKILYKAKEIHDFDTLLQNATKNIHEDSSQYNLLSKSQTSELIGSKGSIDIKILSTSQLLEKVQKADGTIVESYVLTKIAPISNEQLASSSSYDYDYDITGGVKAYSTIYYNRVYDKNNVPHIGMTKVTGGWTIEDNSLSISNKLVNVGQIGFSKFGSTSGQKFSQSPSGFSYSYDVPSNWNPVNIDSTSSVGMSAMCKITRSGSSWSFAFGHTL